MRRVRRFPSKARAHDEISGHRIHTVLQGVERGVWKWTASVAGVVIMGQAAIKSKAVAGAEKAIDRALAAKKVRLVRPEDKIDCGDPRSRYDNLTP